MTWFKVDDNLHSHKKTMRAGVEAMGLWVLAGSWVGDQLTDGWVPWYAAQRITNDYERLAERLVKAELWMKGEVEGEEGWWFHEWAERQPMRDEVMERRRKRSEAGRLGGQRSGLLRSIPQVETQIEASASASATADAQAKTNPDPTRTLKKKTSSNQGLDAATTSTKFAEFWTAYPRREAKKGARDIFARLVRKGLDPDVLIAGAKRYAAYLPSVGRDREKTKLPTTWLNQGCWEDELDGGTGIAVVVPLGNREDWLREMWRSGDVHSIGSVTSLAYEEPDLPDHITTKAELEAFSLQHRREWINTNHEDILNQLNREEAA